MSFFVQKTLYIARIPSDLNNTSSLDDKDLEASQRTKRKLDALNISPVKLSSKRRKVEEDTRLGLRPVNSQSTENFIKTSLTFLQTHANDKIIDFLKTINEKNRQYLFPTLLYLINKTLDENNVPLFADIMNFIIVSEINVFEELDFQKLLKRLFKEKKDKNVNSFNDLKVMLVDPNDPTVKSSIHCSSSVLRLNAPHLQIINNKVTINGPYESCSQSFISLIKTFYGFHQKISSEEEYRSFLIMTNQLGANHLTSEILRSLPENLKNQPFVWVELIFRYGTVADFQWVFSRYSMEGFEDILNAYSFFSNMNINEWFENLLEVEKWVSIFLYCNQIHQFPFILQALRNTHPAEFVLTDICYQMFLLDYNVKSSSDATIRVADGLFFINQTIINLTNPALMRILLSHEKSIYQESQDEMEYEGYDLTDLLLKKGFADLTLALCYCPYEKMDANFKQRVDRKLEKMSVKQSSQFESMVKEFELGDTLLQKIASRNSVNSQDSLFNHSGNAILVPRTPEEVSFHDTMPFPSSQNGSVDDVLLNQYQDQDFVPDSQE